MKNIYKFIIFNIFILINISCFDIKNRRTIELIDKPSIVIDTSTTILHTYGKYGSETKYFYIKVYSNKDKNVEWFEINYDNYKKIKINDTLSNYIINNEI